MTLYPLLRCVFTQRLKGVTILVTVMDTVFGILIMLGLENEVAYVFLGKYWEMAITEIDVKVSRLR